MKAKSALFAVLMVLSLILFIVASPGHSYAGNPEGFVCFEDSLGDFWFLDFGSFFSGLNFDVHGFLAHSAVSCNGTFIEPVSGTATFGADNTIVLGVSSIAVGSGADSADCEPIFWHVVIDASTFETILGSFVSQSGIKNTSNLILTEIDCNSFPLIAAGKKSQSLKGRLQR